MLTQRIRGCNSKHDILHILPRRIAYPIGWLLLRINSWFGRGPNGDWLILRDAISRISLKGEIHSKAVWRFILVYSSEVAAGISLLTCSALTSSPFSWNGSSMSSCLAMLPTSFWHCLWRLDANFAQDNIWLRSLSVFLSKLTPLAALSSLRGTLHFVDGSHGLCHGFLSWHFRRSAGSCGGIQLHWFWPCFVASCLRLIMLLFNYQPHGGRQIV